MKNVMRITFTAFVNAVTATGIGVALMFPECADLLVIGDSAPKHR